MNQEAFLQRAQLLISQHRSAEAADQLRQLLARDPNVSEAHALLALCLLDNADQWHEATREAEQAIHISPDSGLSHYALAAVLEKRDRLPEALTAVREALRLDPYACHHYGLCASILAQLKRWQEALDIASQGMEIDPDDAQCAALRSLSLERLGRTTDAALEADAAVARNPDSAEAHAMRGWTQMQKGQYREAQDAFREALRLNPTYEFARTGMIQALNNNHLLFRLVFKFYSLLGRLAGGAQWAIIIGLFLGIHVLRGLADANPALEPYVMPISFLYLGFCLLSWIANPLFNTFLRFHPFGKYLLSSKQKWASNLVAGCMLLGVGGAAALTVRGDWVGAIIMLLAPVFLTLPISTAFEVDEGWPLIVTGLLAIALTLLCFSAMALLAINGPWIGLYGMYMLGILVFSFAGNWLKSVTVRH